MKKCVLVLMVILLAAAGICAVTAEPDATPAGEESAGAPVVQAPVRGYILVSTATQAGFLPLAAEGEEYEYPLVQQRTDGSITVNLLHITDHGVYMKESTCENQDCVYQGEVTLENRESRILSNMIICLPNQVMLSLYTPEELIELYGQGAE